MKKEIFIIDDDPIYTMIVSKMINKIDASLSINKCENGEVGLAQLENLRHSNHCLITFLDINMPVVNGWEFLDEIKNRNFFNIQELVIYMVSSSTNESDVLRAKQYEFVRGFFHKPLSTADIKTIIGID
jgi:CheY-like chemotaxis protein